MTASKTLKTILIVDDEPINRILLKKIFSTEYNVLEAKDGLETIQILKSGIEVSAVILDLYMPKMDGFGVLTEMKQDSSLNKIPVLIDTAADDVTSQNRALSLGAVDVIAKPYNPLAILHRVNNLISVMNSAQIAEENKWLSEIVKVSEFDQKTGIWNQPTFNHKVRELLTTSHNEKFVLARWDLDHFKVFNDLYGTNEGDILLKKIGDSYHNKLHHKGHPLPVAYGNYTADHFVTLWKLNELNPQQVYQDTIGFLNQIYPYYKFTLHYGFYQIDDPNLDVGTICDRALMALSSIKSSYSEHFAWYDSSMRNRIVEEQELTSIMQDLLDQKRFVIYFQPQYNYATGQLSGAEALVRLQHPTKGLIMPGVFIPIFEKNGFIFELDKYVWDQTFAQVREWLDAGIKPPIISMNISRRDVYHPQLVSIFEDLVKKYQLNPAMIGLEITESSYMGSPEQLLSIVSRLQKIGFRLEMYDFGSGYSSLNTLKDLPVNVLKLDLAFIAQSSYNSRGGKILSSVVHMAHMINLPVIAEGVETRQQADYLKSIGCYLMQGYYFSKPIPATDFTNLLQNSEISSVMRFHFESTVDNSADFLDYSTQTTLLFNSFVGGAAIIEYQGNQINPVRLNDNFLKTLGLKMEDIENRYWAYDYLTPESKPVFHKMLDQSLSTSLETNCQTELVFPSHQQPIWTLNRVRLLAKEALSSIFYLSIENITEQKNLELGIRSLNERLTAIIDSIPGGIAEFKVIDKTIYRTYLSPKAANILGYASDDIIPVKFTDTFNRIHPADLDILTTAMDLAAKQGKVVNVDMRILPKDAPQRWVNLAANPVTENGEVHFYGVYSDITARKENENSELNALYHETGGANYTIVLKKKPTMEYFSEALCKSSGYQFAELKKMFQKDCLALIVPEDKVRLKNMAMELAKNPGFKMLEYRFKHHDKTIHNSRDIIYCTYDANGVCRIHGDSYDITTYHKHKEQLNIAQQESRSIVSQCSKDFLNYDLITKELTLVKKPNFEIYPSEVIKSPQVFKRRLPSNQYTQWLDYFRQLSLKHLPETLRIQIKNTNGHYNWYVLHSWFIYDEKAQPLRAVVAIENIMHSLFETDKEEFNQQNLNIIIGQLPFSFILSNKERNEVFYSGGNLMEDLGYTNDDLVRFYKKGFVGLFAPEYLGKYRSLMINESPMSMTFPMTKPDGSQVFVTLRSHHISSDSDTPYVYTILTKATDFSKQTEVLKLTEQQLSFCENHQNSQIIAYDYLTSHWHIPEDYASWHQIVALKENQRYPDKTVNEYISNTFGSKGLELFEQITSGKEKGKMTLNFKDSEGNHHAEHFEYLNLFIADHKPLKALIAVKSLEEVKKLPLPKPQREVIINAFALHSDRIGYFIDANAGLARALDPRQTAKNHLPISYKASYNLTGQEIGLVPDSTNNFLHFIKEIKNGQTNPQTRIHLYGTDKIARWYDVRLTTLEAMGKTLLSGYVISLLDISDEHEKELAYSRYSHALTDKTDAKLGFFECDLDANYIERLNGNQTDIPLKTRTLSSFISTYFPEVFIASNLSDAMSFFSAEHLIAAYKDGQRSLSSEWEIHLAIEARRRFIRVTIQLALDPYTEHIIAFETINDITKAKESILFIERQAELDGLTEIYNRATTESIIKQQLSDPETKNCLLILLDMDNLKHVNDTYGHAQGDRAIRSIAKCLHSHFRSSDIIGRLGGDEFIVFLPRVSTSTNVNQYLNRMLEKLSRIRIGEDNDVAIHCSAGCTLGTATIDTFDIMYKHADQALYYVKRNGKSHFALYTETMKI